jgi:hypothetical protein
MATHTTDFWPDDIRQSNQRTPVALLREQATALGEKTRNVVTAEVESDSAGQEFVHELYLVAPVLHYRYQLLTIRHPLFFYPMGVTVPDTFDWDTVDSEEAFVVWLKGVLASDKTKKVIQALIDQSQGS